MILIRKIKSNFDEFERDVAAYHNQDSSSQHSRIILNVKFVVIADFEKKIANKLKLSLRCLSNYPRQIITAIKLSDHFLGNQ